MSYDLRDINNVRIIAVAKKLDMKLGFRGEQIHGECPFRFANDGIHEPLSLVFDKTSNMFRCTACGNSGTAFDLVCQVAHVGPSEAIEWIGKNFCLPGVAGGASRLPSAPGEEKPEEATKPKPTPPTLSEVYADFLRLLGEPSPDTIAYMQSRGISIATVEKHGVTDIKGYHGTATFLKEKYPPELLRQAGLFDATGKLWFEEYPLILPYFRDGKVAFLQAHCMDSNRKPRYLRPKEAVPFLHNVDVLRVLGDGDSVFLVEGIIDCLTLEERGYRAVGAPSMSAFKPEWVKDFRRLETYLVHCGEEAAERAAHAIAVVFAKSDLSVRSIRLPRGHDVNSFFGEGGIQPEFEHLVQTVPRIKTARPVLLAESRAAMAEFLDDLRQHEKRTKASGRSFLGLDTGFPVLSQICGGLDSLGSGQLCVVTGPPGVGKTTFCLQTAWQVLENNEVAVLLASYNEGRFVLRLKTLCQLSKMAASSVLRGQIQADRLASAVEEMSKWGKGFFLVEGNKSTTVEILRDYCERVKSITGETRVLLVVDHLEAIPFPDPNTRGSAKIEACAAELNFLSRELAIPVMVVSSTAARSACRASQGHNGPGDVQYWEDLLLVLEQDVEAGKQRFLENEGLAVKVRVAKNRSGHVGAVMFDFFPDCHYFKERGRAVSTTEMPSEPQPHETKQTPEVHPLEARSPASKSARA
jgi:hypothetical protein